MPDTSVEEKIEKLRNELLKMGSVLVAFSGGTDSSLLAKAAIDALNNNVFLVTAVSETFTSEERERAEQLAVSFGARHIIIESTELADQRFKENTPERCYFCKTIRLTRLEQIRQEKGMNFIIDGTNADDAADYRPGGRAAREFGVRHPLADCGFAKSDVRAASKLLGLTTWSLPSQACLASRIPYGTPITPRLLGQVRDAEKFLSEIYPGGNFRVRHHGDTVRIEAGQEIIAELASEPSRRQIVEKLRYLGYKYVTLDLQGYRTGSMNEAIVTGDGGEKK